MPRKRKTPGDQPEPARAQTGAADIDRLLERVDQAAQAGNQEQVLALMEPLWKARRKVPEALTQRLLGGRAAFPAFAFDLLGGFAGERAPTYFNRIADARNVEDIVRFGAKRRAGWAEEDEAERRLAFLETLREPDETLLVAIDQGSESWPPQSEILQEVLGYLVLLASERRLAIVERAVRESNTWVALLLYALLHVDDRATQRLALSELVRLRDLGAAAAIDRLARTTYDADLRVEATAACRRLRLQVVGREEPVNFPPLPPLERAYLSVIDSQGGQLAVVVRNLGGELFQVAHFLYRDDEGIKDSYGLSRVQADRWESMIEEANAQGAPFVEVDLAAIRGFLAAAVEVSAANGHGILPVFELWELLAHDAYPPPADEPVTVPELDERPYAGRQDLIRSSDRLLEHPFFYSWVFNPVDTSLAMLDVPLPSRGRWTDRQYRPLIERLVDASMLAGLRQRLRRQAWLLEKAGHPAERDLALATAASLTPLGVADITKHPFLRRMVERTAVDFFDVLSDIFQP